MRVSSAETAQTTAETEARAAEGRAAAAEGAQTLAEREVTAAQARAEAAEAAQAAAEREARVAEARAAAAEAAQTAAEREARAAEARAAAAEASLAAAETEARAAEGETRAAEMRAAEAQVRASSAEDEVAEALLEVQRMGEQRARLQVALEAIQEAGQCPILQEPCREPVVASDGHTYERHALEAWLLQSRTSPMTRAPLDLRLYPNRFASKVAQELADIGLGLPNAAGSADADGSATSQPPEDVPLPDLGSLWAALQENNEGRALWLLRQPQLPDLNDIDEEGRTVLHVALEKSLPEAALLIAARQDFSRINVQTTRLLRTALHQAAFRGYLEVCRVILTRPDFTRWQAADNRGKTAMHLAQLRGEHAVVLLLGGH